MCVNGRPTKMRRIQRAEEVPEEQLHQQRRAAKEPDVGPGDADSMGFSDSRMTAISVPPTCRSPWRSPSGRA